MSLSRRRFIETTAAASALFATTALGSSGASDKPSLNNPIAGPANAYYEAFGDRARNVMHLAHQQAFRFDHEIVGTEHLLLALFLESEVSGTNWLAELGISYADIDCVTSYVVGQGDSLSTKERLDKSENLKICLDEAVDLTCDSGHIFVEPEHLMLGIVESFGTTANLLLQEMWMERGQIRQVAKDSLA